MNSESKHSALLAVAILSAAVFAALAFATRLSQQNKPERDTVEQSADGMYLETPGGGSIYKYYDASGMLCGILVVREVAVDLECVPSAAEVPPENPEMSFDEEVAKRLGV